VLVDVITIFPDMVDAPLRSGILGRAREAGIVDIRIHDLRDHCRDRHRVTDEPPYGGGPGMVMKPEPFFRAVEHCLSGSAARGTSRVVLMTPQGRTLTHHLCEEMARDDHLVLLCSRYEGVDERVRQWAATHEVSVGDYVLSGGEIAALAVVDAVVRLVPGVVGDPESLRGDSFADGLLEGPHYTRPREYRGLAVPDILRSGDHGAVEEWRSRESIIRTRTRRPEMLSTHRRWQYYCGR